MVVKSDGSKWACSSCLKGHRVSGCNHVDRELTLVPKKGRPVTQCHHCRLERKKRAAHVKCDCGEVEKVHHPREKCIHLREAEERAKAGLQDDVHAERDPGHLVAVAEEQGCCCHHGGKCTCSLAKREGADRDRDGAPHGPAVHKPRLDSIKSDGSITVFANGHHKPVHRKNNAAHECGMPYRMPLPRAHTDQALSTSSRHSVDGMYHVAQSAPSNAGSTSASEQPSPQMMARNSVTDMMLPFPDFSALGPAQSNQSVESIDSVGFPAFDPLSAVDSTYDPWSAFPSSDSLNFSNGNAYESWPIAFDSAALAQPALTAGSSGTQSDVDEVPAMEEMYNFAMPSIAEHSGMDVAPGDVSGSNRRSLPPNFFGNADFSSLNAESWQPPANTDGQTFDAEKSKVPSAGEGPIWNDSWTAATASYRGLSVTSQAGRPPSHSVGPGSAPNEDIIRQLFPDFDVPATYGSAITPGNQDSPTMKRFNSMPTGLSAFQMDLPATVNGAFIPQQWVDGSVNVPSDAFDSALNMEQEYQTSGYSSDWQNNQ